jgi:hypothetical protein
MVVGFFKKNNAVKASSSLKGPNEILASCFTVFVQLE